MFAVIRTGGKQYRVVKDDKIIVEKIIGEPGSMIELSDVLMIGGEKEKLSVGSPVVDKAAVFAEVVEQSRANKILVFKKNRRKNYRRTRGHRQEQTVLRIIDVSPSGIKPKIADAKLKTKTKVKTETSVTKPAKNKEVKTSSSEKKKSNAKKVTKTNPKTKTKTKE
jgi:large subunit ribosomal protein L21